MMHVNFPTRGKRCVEELLHHWPAVVLCAENDWAKNFATSIARQARRPAWRPSPKQEALMRRLVEEMLGYPDEAECHVIE